MLDKFGLFVYNNLPLVFIIYLIGSRLNNKPAGACMPV
jgi:hypothetical protein